MKTKKNKSEEEILTEKEIMEYLTSVVMGKSKSQVVVVVKDSEGSHVEYVDKYPDEKEKLKAVELMGKKYGLFIDKQEIKMELPVIICGEEDI